MDRIAGFDPGLGVSPLRDGGEEIGRANLPGSSRVIPESPGEKAAETPIFGRVTDSALLERFAAFLAPGLEHRELLSPDVFFAVLEEALGRWEEKGSGGDGGEGPLVEAARTLAEVLADKNLCDMLRNMIFKA